MDDELLEENYDGKHRVEVSVTTGGVSAVSFTTIIVIDASNKTKAQGALRDMANLLRAALPFTELKSEEQEFNAKHKTPVGVDAGGPVDKEQALIQSQEALKSLGAKK